MSQRLPSDNPLIVSYLTLRRVVGWVAVLLPVVLLISNAFFTKDFKIYVSSRIFVFSNWPGSVSGYYYTSMRDVFVGSLCALGVFLIGYNGYDRADRWITNLAGVCAIGVALCPTKPSGAASQLQIDIGIVHVVFAISVITLMGVMALRFAKTGPGNKERPLKERVRVGLGFGNTWPDDNDDERIRRKKRSNVVYRFCGFLILLCVASGIGQNFLPTSIKKIQPWLFWIETIAILAFGLSWFVKGRALLPIRRRQTLSRAQVVPDAEAVKAAVKVRQLHKQADELAAAAANPTRQAVTQLVGSGESVGGVASQLGISPQRASELTAEVS
jgi:hypothetical protein